jgi:hypothetical protein
LQAGVGVETLTNPAFGFGGGLAGGDEFGLLGLWVCRRRIRPLCPVSSVMARMESLYFACQAAKPVPTFA